MTDITPNLRTSQTQSLGNIVMKMVAVLIAGAICGLIGAYVAVFGAVVSGLKLPSSGSWDLTPLVFMMIGLLSAVLSHFGLMLALTRISFGSRLGISVVFSIAIAFMSGVISYPLYVLLK